MNVNGVILVISYLILGLKSSVLRTNVSEITSQGLYHNGDKVTILAKQNFDLLYGQKQAWLVQFYNSFCGHCRAFLPKFKQFAADVELWKKAVHLGVLDCSVEDNVDICRRFEVMVYPSLRYMHEGYTQGNTFIGESFNISQKPEILTENLLKKLIDEKSKGRLKQIPSFEIEAYDSLSEVLMNVPPVKYTFMVIETSESTEGSMVILDTMDCKDIAVKRVLSTSPLARDHGVSKFPGLIAVHESLEVTVLTPEDPSRASLKHAIDVFMEMKNMPLPSRRSSQEYTVVTKSANAGTEDIVNMADLETTLRSSLHTEVARYKQLRGEALEALMNYLTVNIDYFPFRANGRDYLIDLRSMLKSRNLWTGEEVADLLHRLENLHYPAYSSRLEFVGCRGSEPRYRGYTCGLWMLFHTLTVSAASKSNGHAPDVLLAMLGYVKHFFGCTDCSKHFQDMALRNKIHDVQQNDKAVLWLWIAHNEVNLRLAGDETEDPEHPKIQFPSAERCSECRETHGPWRLTAVYSFLSNLYNPHSIQDDRPWHRSPAPLTLSPLDVALTAFMYIFSFGIILLACKLFLSRTRRKFISLKL